MVTSITQPETLAAIEQIKAELSFLKREISFIEGAVKSAPKGSDQETHQASIAISNIQRNLVEARKELVSLSTGDTSKEKEIILIFQQYEQTKKELEAKDRQAVLADDKPLNEKTIFSADRLLGSDAKLNQTETMVLLYKSHDAVERNVKGVDKCHNVQQAAGIYSLYGEKADEIAKLHGHNEGACPQAFRKFKEEEVQSLEQEVREKTGEQGFRFKTYKDHDHGRLLEEARKRREEREKERAERKEGKDKDQPSLPESSPLALREAVGKDKPAHTKA